MSEAKAKQAASATGVRMSDQKYSAELVNEIEGPVVRFRGTISTQSPSALLNPFVDAVHERLVKSGAPAVLVDFRELEFCNSSGFKAFIHWIERIQEVSEAGRYRLCFITSPARRWQRTSLLALSCFAPDEVELK
jgi:anti-anti-sigma regulatory factor